MENNDRELWLWFNSDVEGLYFGELVVQQQSLFFTNCNKFQLHLCMSIMQR